jgi:hypothetical protein
LALSTGHHLDITCLLQVLARDIRSLHQRKTVLPVLAKQQQQQQQQQQGIKGSSLSVQQIDSQSQAACSTMGDNSNSGTILDAGAAAAADGGDVSGTKGRYVVGLDGVSVSYDVCSDTGRVYVRGACLAS